jgi:Uma2 family endonuclease
MVKGDIRDYTDHHPRTAVLLVEVADTTLAFDRMKKAAVYARNGIPEYWILNLRDRTLEVHRDPEGDAYTEQWVLASDQGVSPLVAPGAHIEVSELLP